MAEFRFLVHETLIALLCLVLSIPPATASIESIRAPATNGSCIAEERTALLSIKASLFDPTGQLASWQGADCCSWSRVRCSNKTGHIIKLKLRGSTDGNRNIHAEFGGAISYSLTSLQKLRYLDLSCNNFNGSQIPHFVGSLSSLRYLNLSFSFFYGGIPPQLGNLSKLIYLDLKPTTPTGLYELTYLFSVDLAWLSHLSSLKYLDMSCVNLSTAVDWVHEINMLPTLKNLYLIQSGLVNTVPLLRQSNLTSLELLDISANNFSTSLSPNWFWNVTSLTFLKLTLCYFYGPIPDEIGSMSSLEQVSFSGNNLMSTMIPSNFKNLCNLKVLHLEATRIGGDITQLMESLPNCHWNKLQYLDLSFNNIGGALPNWSGPLANLTYLDLSHNNLTGHLPSWIGTLEKLIHLHVGSNSISGIVNEDHLGNINNLKFLGLSNTRLQMKVSSNWVPPFQLQIVLLYSLQIGPAFPSWLRSQPSVQHLDISNASLTGIPDWFWGVFSKAEFVALAVNQISGTLPATLEFMAANTMILCYNRFTGTIPKFPRNITYMHIAANSLSGTLPSDFGSPLLKALILSNNSISGAVPSSLCSLKQLHTLDISENMLTGEVPTCQDDSNPLFQSLSMVNLNINNLSGEFPSVFKSCPHLVYLDLSHNHFSGNLPLWIGEKLPFLALLRLRSNMFSGHIPDKLAMIEQLQFLDLAQNYLSGSIPNSLVNLTAMASTTGYGYLLNNVLTSGQGATYDMFLSFQHILVSTKGQQLQFVREIAYVVNLDFSSNNLTGVIPRDIGALVALKSLNLSQNRLSGEIPKKIGELNQLESLDLSHNELSGEIPSSMSTLTSLAYLNLSYNNLSGKIPTGNPLDTYEASSYIGNIGLCGLPLTPSCDGNGPATEGNHGDSENISLYLGMIVGFVLNLWVIFCVMLFKNSWRRAYFMFVEDLQDKIYVTVIVRWNILKRKLTSTPSIPKYMTFRTADLN